MKHALDHTHIHGCLQTFDIHSPLPICMVKTKMILRLIPMAAMLLSDMLLSDMVLLNMVLLNVAQSVQLV